MMEKSITIPKNPILEESQDYFWLRKEGLEHIRQLSSKLWTDYNIHDPGITLLELLCYALTDLAHRTNFDINDILAVKPDEVFDPKRQAFFPASEILTMNPLTINDFRKVLVDLEGVKNGWLYPKLCPCEDMRLYVNCKDSLLQYKPETNQTIFAKGLYDVLIEFDDEEGVGDLNSGKMKYNVGFENSGSYTNALIELRLPSWQTLVSMLTPDNADYNELKSFMNPDSAIESVFVMFISGNKQHNNDAPLNEQARVLKRVVYATVEVEFKPNVAFPGTMKLNFKDVPLRVWFKSNADRMALAWEDLKTALSDTSPSGLFPKYHELIHKVGKVMAQTEAKLHRHRNLCEDYCTITAVAVQDVAICADMEVETNADIERVLANAYYQIEQYFSPDIPFYALKELLDDGMAVEAIYNGPLLKNGFIKNDELEQTQLKQTIYVSDIINLLVDIPGVKAVKNVLLTKYDQEGLQIGDAKPWALEIDQLHQPRLYFEGSKFLVYKDNLPFLPDKSELLDTLQVIKGKHLKAKFSEIENELPIPSGTYYAITDYYPLQYSLPLTYGVGIDGLPGNASVGRKAKAKQLKAYLLFFEQILVNYLHQLANVKELFAVDASVEQTYFSKLLSSDDIIGIDGLQNGLTKEMLQGFMEDSDEYADRRNRFLDHLIARFAEQMTDYGLMLYNYYENKAIANTILIKNKIAFIGDIPVMGHDRARAINIKDNSTACSSENVSGLQNRIVKILGLDSFSSYVDIYDEHDTDQIDYEKRWRLIDEKGNIYLSSSTKYTDPDSEKAIQLAKAELRDVKKHMHNPARYKISKKTKWVLNLLDEKNEVIATRKQHFSKKSEAEKAKEEIIAFAKKIGSADKVYVVEHLLLRPRNKKGSVDVPQGDPLLNICVPSTCTTCGEDDPYSFRITVILNGETGLTNSNIMFRRFAEKSIRKEVPAHIGVKICWVSSESLETFELAWCAWLSEVSKPEPNAALQSQLLKELIDIFENLKSVYPPAFLHDCVDGNDENRVYMNQTIV